MKVLKAKIREKRIELIRLGSTEGLRSPDVLRVSQELDELINEFQKKVICRKIKTH